MHFIEVPSRTGPRCSGIGRGGGGNSGKEGVGSGGICGPTILVPCIVPNMMKFEVVLIM